MFSEFVKQEQSSSHGVKDNIFSQTRSGILFECNLYRLLPNIYVHFGRKVPEFPKIWRGAELSDRKLFRQANILAEERGPLVHNTRHKDEAEDHH